MIVREIIEPLNLRVVAGSASLNREITGGYTADLLSCVMARAKPGNIWVTLQAHPNVIAVAVLLELAAVIVTEDAPISSEVAAKAEAEKLVLLATPRPSFAIVAALAQRGILAQE